jgi:uncharacterized protein YpmS
VQKNKESEIAVNKVRGEAGLLARIEALHQYTWNNKAALVGWALCFFLILAFEVMVVLVKLVFNETVDDEIERIKEKTARFIADQQEWAITSPLSNAVRLIGQTV